LDEVFHVCYGNKNASASFFFVDNSKSTPEVVAAHKRIREAALSADIYVEKIRHVLIFHLKITGPYLNNIIITPFR